MSVTIRLARHGRKKEPFYRVVVADREMKRDGRYLELVGTVNPLTEPATVLLKEDRIKHWIEVGARPSQTVSEKNWLAMLLCTTTRAYLHMPP